MPGKNYGALISVIGTIEEQEDGAYKIPDDLMNAKAAYFPIIFSAYPVLKPENYIHYIVQNVSFTDAGPYYDRNRKIFKMS